jgi:hypothetical protein
MTETNFGLLALLGQTEDERKKTIA